MRLWSAKLGALGVLMAVVAWTTACDASQMTDLGGGGGGSGGDAVVVHLTASDTYSPAEVTIGPGTTVRWVNDAALPHTVTPQGHSEWTRRELTDEGETFEHTFDTEGTFPYYCEFHQSQGMTGTVIVQVSTGSY